MASTSKSKVLRSGERKTVLAVYEYFKKKFVEKIDSFSVSETCKATDIGRNTFYRIIKEAIQGSLETPRENRTTGKTYKSSLKIKYDGFVRNAVWRKLHYFLFDNIPPTLDMVLNAVNDDEDLPTFKKTRFYRILKEIGFECEKRGNKALLIERNDIILLRHDYLRKIKKYRVEGRNIVFLDETWVNVGNTVQNCWIDKTIKSRKEAFLAGTSIGLKRPVARGPRFIITHAGGEAGFILETKWCFLQKMRVITTMKWMERGSSGGFVEQLLPKPRAGSIIVIDNA